MMHPHPLQSLLKVEGVSEHRNVTAFDYCPESEIDSIYLYIYILSQPSSSHPITNACAVDIDEANVLIESKTYSLLQEAYSFLL